MTLQCPHCGKPLEISQAQFCPFCGASLRQTRQAEISPEAERYLQQAAATNTVTDREKVLRQAQAACPDCLPIEWELLFIGHDKHRRGKGIDYSMIKCFLLDMYAHPQDFSEVWKRQDREELFGDPQLQRCIALSGDGDRAMSDYLMRLCREYIALFIEGDRRTNGTLFGLRLGWNSDKNLSENGAAVLRRIRRDDGLTPEQRQMLGDAFYQALCEELKGETRYLKQALGE